MQKLRLSRLADGLPLEIVLMTTVSLLDQRLPKALRAAGLTVVELGRDNNPGSDWSTVSTGTPMRAIGQAIHWDAIGAGIDPLRWATLLQSFPRFNGAPTYHGGVYDDGTIYLWAAGKTVNVGKVDSRVEAAVRSRTALPRPRSGDTYGNGRWIGWTIRYHPDEGPIPPAQLESLLELCAITCRVTSLPASAVLTHAELTTRKIDIPLEVEHRALIRNYLAALAGFDLENDMNTTELPKWEIKRRATDRMRQLYEEIRGPGKLPDKAGWQWWMGVLNQRVEEAGVDGATEVIARLETGLRQEVS